MFTINGNLKEFTQWEQGYSLTNPNMKDGDKIQFHSGSGKSCIMEAKEGKVEVPNRMLQHVANITAQFIDGTDDTSFAVKPAKKPKDYVFIDNECKYEEYQSGTGGGGVSSWNDLTDKPFGETVTQKTVTETFGPVDVENDPTSSRVVVDFPHMDIKDGDVVNIKLECTGTDSSGGFTYTGIGETTVSLTAEDAIGRLGEHIGFYLTPEEPIYMVTSKTGTEDDFAIKYFTINYYNEEKMQVVFLSSNEDVTIPITITMEADVLKDVTETTPIPIKYLPESHQFGETTVMGDTLTWDGNTEGLPVVSASPSPDFTANLYKISDSVPSLEDFNNGGYMVYSDGRGMEVTIEQLMSFDGAIAIGEGIIVTTKPNMTIVEIGFTFPEAGVWVMKADGFTYVNKLTINGYTGFETTGVKTIDPKYLPAGTGGGGSVDMSEYFETAVGSTITWDGNTEGLQSVMIDLGEEMGGEVPYYNVSDGKLFDGSIPSSLINYPIALSMVDENGQKSIVDLPREMIMVEGPNMFFFMGVVIANSNMSIMGVTFPSVGVWLSPVFCGDNRVILSFGADAATFETEQIKHEYLPNNDVTVSIYVGEDGTFTSNMKFKDIESLIQMGKNLTFKLYDLEGGYAVFRDYKYTPGVSVGITHMAKANEYTVNWFVISIQNDNTVRYEAVPLTSN